MMQKGTAGQYTGLCELFKSSLNLFVKKTKTKQTWYETDPGWGVVSLHESGKQKRQLDEAK